MKTWEFQDVYINAFAACAGPLEGKGPYGERFDYVSKDLYDGEDSFEKAEISLLRRACDLTLRKALLRPCDIDVAVGGDLMNQLMTTHYFARELETDLIGVYAACATSSLAAAVAAMMIQSKQAEHALAFTSSHNACAERQYRFPNEYGVQKKETTTTTVTGAGAFLLSREKSNIGIHRFTAGRIIDWHFFDASDMGNAMAPAVYDTLKRHLEFTGSRVEDYDLILSGDLSQSGFAFLSELLMQDGIVVDERFNDCGKMIYRKDEKGVFCGGSGCACAMCVTIADVFHKILAKQIDRALVIASGALLSPVATYQKQSIPCIAHAIEYQRRD